MIQLRCHVEYDGTDFCGWQVQVGQPTVQEELEHAISSIVGEAVRVTGAGRTDTGVHALGQVGHFFTDSALPPVALEKAVNAALPEQIAVRDLEQAPAGFHARQSARSRTYRYSVLCSRTRAPLRHRHTLRVGAPLDPDRMREALSLLIGEHDFGAFGSAPGDPNPDASTRRKVFVAEVDRRHDELSITIEADAFLTHMMRCIAGLAIEIGTGRSNLDSVDKALSGRDVQRRSRLAPPHGLSLIRVSYDEADGPYGTTRKDALECR